MTSSELLVLLSLLGILAVTIISIIAAKLEPAFRVYATKAPSSQGQVEAGLARGRWLGRIIKAIRLNVDFYMRVAADPSLTREALLGVLIPFPLASPFSLCPLLLLLTGPGASDAAMEFIMVSALFSVPTLIGFFGRTGLTYLAGRRVFGSTATYTQVQRSLGYAFITRYPGAVVSSVIPGCGIFLAMAWALGSDYVATRSVLGVGKGPALTIVILSPMVIYGTLILLVSQIPDVVAFYKWLFGRLGY